jgi:hypothetical protein
MRNVVDFVMVDRDRAWPIYRSIGQAGIQAISWLVFRYVGIAGIHDNECRHIH